MRGVRSTLLKLPFHGLQALTQINPANHSFDASFRNNDAITIVRRVWQDYTEISSRNLRPPCLWYEDEPVPFRPDARAEYPCATWRPPSCPRRACRSISLPPPSSGRGGRSSWRPATGGAPLSSLAAGADFIIPCGLSSWRPCANDAVPRAALTAKTTLAIAVCFILVS